MHGTAGQTTQSQDLLHLPLFRHTGRQAGNHIPTHTSLPPAHLLPNNDPPVPPLHSTGETHLRCSFTRVIEEVNMLGCVRQLQRGLCRGSRPSRRIWECGRRCSSSRAMASILQAAAGVGALG